MPSACEGSVQELNVPLHSVCFEIEGVKLLVRESGASAAIEVAAADKAVPEILAERVLSWISAARVPDLGSSSAKRNRASVLEAKTIHPSNPQQEAPSAKKRRK